MSHFYKRNELGKIESCHGIKPKEAKKICAWPSVTTKQKIVSNPFLDTWSRREAIKLCQVYPQLSSETDIQYCDRIIQLVFGEFTRHYDNKTMPSNEFGTAVHKCLEDWNLENKSFPPEWEMYCTGWPQWLDSMGIVPHEAEYIVMDDEMKVAGTIDFIGYRDGLVVMCDYKVRQCKDGKGKFYDKDRDQLAIEALIYSEEQGLGYIPECFTINIDALSGQYFVKDWGQDQIAKGIKCFKAINHVFNVLNGWD